MLQLQTEKGLITACSIIDRAEVQQASSVIYRSFDALMKEVSEEEYTEMCLDHFDSGKCFQFYGASIDSGEMVAASRISINEDTAYINRLAVLEKFRGLKISRLLLNQITTDLLSTTDISFLVVNCSSMLIPYYLHLGFDNSRNEIIKKIR